MLELSNIINNIAFILYELSVRMNFYAMRTFIKHNLTVKIS